MPIYEYRCEACNHTFDVRLSVARRNDRQSCPKCAGEQTERLISRTSFALQGGGWAKDGYGGGDGG